MGVLVLLLIAFLLIRWHKRDAGPSVVKEAPTKPEAAAVSPGSPGGPPVAPKDPKEETFRTRVKEAEAAIDAHHWDDAEAAIKAAKELFDRPELGALLERVAKGREAEDAAARAEAEARRNQERAWVETREAAEKHLLESLYDAAGRSLTVLGEKFPKILQDERYLAFRGHVGDLQRDADQVFNQFMGEAKKAFEKEKFSDALIASRKAGGFYPERQALVKEFQEKVNDLLLRKTMIRIVCNIPCTVGGVDGVEEHSVTLNPFYMDKYEVTNEEYYAFVTSTGHEAPIFNRNLPPAWFQGKPVPGKEKHPVTNVTYADAVAYAEWAGKRLPTADEWEVAARGPDKREYPWGNAFTEKENVFHCNCLEYWQVTKTLYSTLPVDAFDSANSASFFGVYGMGGNVWEWTTTPMTRQVAGKPEVFRILKGGSFMTSAKAIRCATVYPEDPTLGHPDVGFRCVRDVK
jgi:hypothetical protein